ncbi:MAG: type IV pilin protein [bacterium]
MKLKRFWRDTNGFTLTELLVVIVIIGILAALTIPRFLNVTTSAKMTEAKLMLKQVYNLERGYYLENDAYSADLQAINFEPEKLKTDGGNARYKIAIAKATETEFVATATAVVDFDKDGAYNVWSINQDGVLKQDVPD